LFFWKTQYKSFNAYQGGRQLSLTHLDMQNPQVTCKGVEWTFPGYSDFKYCKPRMVPSINQMTYSSQRVDMFNILGGNATTVDAQVYVAAGSDYTVTRFRRVPGVILTIPP